MTSIRILAAALLFAFAASAARLAQPVPPAKDKPKASLTVESEEEGDEQPPPIPQGDERKAIGDYIRDNSADIRDCYAKRLSDRPTLSGKLVTRFDIGPNGKVIGAMAEGINDRELIHCVVSVVRRWEFDKPQGGTKLRIAYPFKFEPQPTR